MKGKYQDLIFFCLFIQYLIKLHNMFLYKTLGFVCKKIKQISKAQFVDSPFLFFLSLHSPNSN